MRILVTGGTGFIGRKLAKKLSGFGYSVSITGREPPADGNLEFLGRNFWDLDWKSIGRFDLVFHQAAINDTMMHD